MTQGNGDMPTTPPRPADAANGTATPPPSPVGSKGKMTSGFSTFRDAVSFAVGVGIVLNEVFFAPSIDQIAVGIGFVMMGLPVVFRTDERKKT